MIGDVIRAANKMLFYCSWKDSLGEERANLSAFRTFVRFVRVWICRFPLPFGVWEGLRFVIVALPGLSLTFFFNKSESAFSLHLVCTLLLQDPILSELTTLSVRFRRLIGL